MKKLCLMKDFITECLLDVVQLITQLKIKGVDYDK